MIHFYVFTRSIFGLFLFPLSFRSVLAKCGKIMITCCGGDVIVGKLVTCDYVTLNLKWCKYE